MSETEERTERRSLAVECGILSPDEERRYEAAQRFWFTGIGAVVIVCLVSIPAGVYVAGARAGYNRLHIANGLANVIASLTGVCFIAVVCYAVGSFTCTMSPRLGDFVQRKIDPRLRKPREKA